jgi:hypothetical protein
MATATIELDSLRLSTRISHMSLTLSATMTLLLPSSWDKPATVDQLSVYSRTGQLWISKADQSRLEITTLTDGKPLGYSCSDRLIQQCVVDAVSACPVSWPPTILRAPLLIVNIDMARSGVRVASRRRPPRAVFILGAKSLISHQTFRSVRSHPTSTGRTLRHISDAQLLSRFPSKPTTAPYKWEGRFRQERGCSRRNPFEPDEDEAVPGPWQWGCPSEDGERVRSKSS